MLRARKNAILGAAFVAILAAGVGVLVQSGSEEAIAQNNTNRLPALRVQYSSSYVNEVVPGSRNDKIQEVYKFPDGGPVFIVRTENALTVWARYESSLVRLRTINLEETLLSLTFLDDQRTFIVHTKSEARVYSVDRTFIEGE